MRYEKKMMILTGKGKGVVLIEKSGLGVRFALRTFDVAADHGLKAGVITEKCVFVRELPQTANPSAVFYLDIEDISELHFALFDSEITLYGATGERMWESNLLDLFNKHMKPLPVFAPVPASLPPLPPPEQKLSLPDGTGGYKDERIADGNFYTPFDLSSRLSEVDGFLDGKRALNDTSQTPAADEARPEKDLFAPPFAESENFGIPSGAEAPDYSPERERELEFARVSAEPVEPVENANDEHAAREESKTEYEAAEIARSEQYAAGKKNDLPEKEAAATSDMPWVKHAEWLKSRSSRELCVKTLTVRPVKRSAEIRKIRTTDFFEQKKTDVEKLFGGAPKDDALCKLVPDLAWVKVKTGNGTVSVGRGGDRVLCYAVPGEYQKVSPIGEEAQWLPKQKSAPTGKGYWLVFQDMSTGELIKS